MDYCLSDIDSANVNIMHDINEMASICTAWKKNPTDAIALVTLVAKEGSSYRQPGARMLVFKDCSFTGGISGGCLEQDIASQAIRLSNNNQSYAVEEIDTRPVFGCNGMITIFIEIISQRHKEFEQLMNSCIKSITNRLPLQLVTYWSEKSEKRGTRICENLKKEDLLSFKQSYEPRKRLIVIGGHQDVEPVLEYANILNWEAIQVLPGQQRHGWICKAESSTVNTLSAQEISKAYPPDDSTAIIIMTHNIGRDVQYAYELLPLNYGYIGMLGSSTRRNEVFDHLLGNGLENAPDLMERLFCPIGLDIGAETSNEIALSIICEIKTVLSSSTACHLKNKLKPIHQQVEKLDKTCTCTERE